MIIPGFSKTFFYNMELQSFSTSIYLITKSRNGVELILKCYMKYHGCVSYSLDLCWREKILLDICLTPKKLCEVIVASGHLYCLIMEHAEQE